MIERYSPVAQDIRLLFAQMGQMQRDWQDNIGFGDEGHRLRQKVEERTAVVADVEGLSDPGVREHAALRLAHAEDGLRNYYIAKLALITTEVAEAIEEVRNGHGMTEAYYVDRAGIPTQIAADDLKIRDFRGYGVDKPEGVPSELADVVIRCWSLAGGLGLDLGEAIVEKLIYNGSRAQRHGGKAI